MLKITDERYGSWNVYFNARLCKKKTFNNQIIPSMYSKRNLFSNLNTEGAKTLCTF